MMKDFENVIMNNTPLANRTDKAVSTETDNEVTAKDVTDNVTIVTATVNTRPRRLTRNNTLYSLWYEKFCGIAF